MIYLFLKISENINNTNIIKSNKCIILIFGVIIGVTQNLE